MLNFIKGNLSMKKSLPLYILAMLLFSFSGILSSHISLPSEQTVLVKCALSFVVMLIVFLVGRKKVTFYKHFPQFICLIISGIFLGINWLFVYKAYGLMGVGSATLITYSAPILLMLVAPFLFKEKMPSVVGFIAIVGGFVLLSFQTFSANISLDALTCGMFSAAALAAMILFYKKTDKIPGTEKGLWQAIAALVTVFVAMGIQKGFSLELITSIHIQSSDIVPLLLLGVVASGIGNWIYFISMDGLSVQQISAFSYLNPLFAVVVSALLTHGTLSLQYIVGCVLVCVGILLFCIVKKKPKKD